MSLLSPLWLTLGVMALAVIALHTVRRRQIPVPSTLIWRLIAHTGQARRRLHPPRVSLPLLLQVAIVLLAAIALAQPLLGDPRPRHTIYVLDASASMQTTDVTPDRFMDARAQIAQSMAVSVVDETHRVSIIAVAGGAEVIAARQAERVSASQALASIVPSDGGGGWDELGDILPGIVRSEEVTSMLIVSDGTDAGADFDVADIAIERRVVGSHDPANASLSVAFAPASGTPNTWQIDGDVSFSGAMERAEVTVSFLPEGAADFLDWSSFEVERQPGAPSSAFSQTFTFPSAGTVVLSLPADAASYDNAQGRVLRAAPRDATVLYVGAGNTPLEQALLAVRGVRLFKSEALSADAGRYDLVVLDGVAIDEAPSTSVLWIGNARLNAEPASAEAVPVSPVAWKSNHRLAEGVTWGAIDSEPAFTMAKPAGSDVLLEGPDGPLVSARTLTAGREVRIAFPLMEGAWRTQPGFPIFIANLVDWLGVDTGALVETSCIAGMACPIEARLVAAPILAPDGTTLPPVAGEAKAWLPSGLDASFDPEQAGLYDIGGQIIAVDAPRTEANPSQTAIDVGLPIETSVVPIALWLALAIICCLLIEAIVAGRGQEQFLRSAALVQRSPIGVRRRWTLGLRLGALAAAVASLLWVPLPAMQAGNTLVLVSDLGAPHSGQPRTDLLGRPADDGCSSGGVGIVTLEGAGAVAADVGCAAMATDAPPLTGTVAPALELAASMLPPQGGRIVLASSGGDSPGALAAILPTLLRRGVPVDVLPLDDAPAGDATVASVTAPQRVLRGDRFAIETIVHATAAGRAVLTVSSAGTDAAEQTVDLVPGANRFETIVSAAEGGLVPYEVALALDDDPVPGNNIGGAVVDVVAAPRVAILTPQSNWGGYLAGALELQNIKAEVIDSARAPATMTDWLDYDAVVLANVPAIQLSTAQQQQLEQLVRVHGRGLMILGGENSFGPGGYYRTPLEDVSPLSARAPQDSPLASIVFVIDRSGSMSVSVGGLSRLDIAKHATAQAIDLLDEDTQVGVVTFNNKASAIVPLQARRNVTGVREALAPLAPRGGTSLVVAVETALDQLAQVDAPIRHIVAMSDGLSQPLAFEQVLKRALEMDATLSIVAIGDVADPERLADIASRGGGAFHQTRDFRALPSILSREALLLNGDSLEHGPATVDRTGREMAALAGLPNLPPVDAYVRTSIKPGADLHFDTHDEDGASVPILASWTYGSGRVMSLATHGAGTGNVSWQRMQSFPLVVAQPLRHLLSRAQGPGLNVSLTRDGDDIVVDVLHLDAAERPLDDTVPTAERLGPDGTNRDVDLEHVGPGQYRGRVSAGRLGLIEVAVAAGDERTTAGIDVAYPSRLNFTRTDHDQLIALASATGGRVLTGGESLSVDTEWTLHPTWRPWLLLMLCLLMADLVVRYAPGALAIFRRKPSISPTDS